MAARRAVWVSGLVVVAQFALFLLIGVGLWSFYQLPPPAVPFNHPDRIFARFILGELPVGLVGLLLGAIFAAAMTSSLNSCATVAVSDLYVPWTRGQASPERQLCLTRILTAVFGAVQIALGIAAFTTGIVLGVFFLGMFTRRVGQRAALAGLVAGFAGMTWIYFGTSLAWPWYALAGSLMTGAVGLAVRNLWGREGGLA
jgi:Na+/proline symporter